MALTPLVKMGVKWLKRFFAKIMKNPQNREIGELISEITEKGFGIMEIDVWGSGKDGLGIGGAIVRAEPLASHAGEPVEIEAGNLSECLGFIVDSIRHQRGEPSREEELAKMLAEDKEHADAPPVEIGPDACCTCGSRNPLRLERKIQVLVYWQDGEVFGITGAEEFNRQPQPGEIAHCPDCGKHWTFHA